LSIINCTAAVLTHKFTHLFLFQIESKLLRAPEAIELLVEMLERRWRCWRLCR